MMTKEEAQAVDLLVSELMSELREANEMLAHVSTHLGPRQKAEFYTSLADDLDEYRQRLFEITKETLS